MNSLDENKFKSYGIICQKLEIVIDNGDNQPLNLDSIEIKGYEHMLIGRFNKPASYYLVYGKDYENKPNYDLAHFKDKIPNSLISLNLGEEQKIEQKEPTIKEPLFKTRIYYGTYPINHCFLRLVFIKNDEKKLLKRDLIR